MSTSESSTRGILRRREFLGFSIRVTDGGVEIAGPLDALGVSGSDKSSRRFLGGG
jgi:hypothetical protein